MPKVEKIDMDALDTELDKYLPQQHENDTFYDQHCSRCGGILVRYNRDWDGHRNERGDRIQQAEYTLVFGRRLCQTCSYFVLTQLILALKKLKKS